MWRYVWNLRWVRASQHVSAPSPNLTPSHPHPASPPSPPSHALRQCHGCPCEPHVLPVFSRGFCF